ncbi:formate dehydrogenase major subunit [Halarsenatibacter silvermanii]|nr:formate dehydrogenase major subunit [Halarsenatibacter silvermanii]
MPLTRRDFFKVSGMVAGGMLAGSGSDRVLEAEEYESLRIEYAEESTSICPFCSVGCGVICHSQDGDLVNIEGDPDHPISEGTLCSKGSSLINMGKVYDEEGKGRKNPGRVTRVYYREPHGEKWQVKDWDWALEKIAERIKNTRDETFEEVDEEGVTVNRTTSIAHLGSAMVNNEENYIFHKLTRALGLVNIDHCARL